MTRTYVITGSASGIGAATSDLLKADGHRVIGVDLRNADVIADLSNPRGRQHMIEEVQRRAGGSLNGVVACAGVGGGQNPPDRVISVNYFGARATLVGLRPLLAKCDRPRAAAVSSIALMSGQTEPTQLCLDGRERAAIRACNGDGRVAYAAAKRAIARWAIDASVTPEWAGKGIALNVVAPGMVISPLSEYYLGTEEMRAEVLKTSPQPFKGIGEPIDIAEVLVWLCGTRNRFVTGELIFADGGYQALESVSDLPTSSGAGLF